MPDLLVDGIVGIGGRPGLRPDAVAALERFAAVPVVAVDVPSGVDVDGGTLDGPHVRADLTVTFGTHKVAHLVDPACLASGAVHLVDLGLDGPELGPPVVEALQPDDVRALLPRPDDVAHKYTRGVVGVRAGSGTYPGAALLAVSGANSGLVGMVRYVGPAAIADTVRSAHPEVVGDGRVQAWVVGPGGGDDAGTMLAEARADDVPVVVDADALRHVDGTVPGCVLTPHAGELAAMLGIERAGRRGLAAGARARRGDPLRLRGPAEGAPHARRQPRRAGPGDHHRGAVARHRRSRRRAHRARRCAARGGTGAVRRRVRRFVAARSRRDPGSRRRTADGEPRRGPDPAAGARRPRRFGMIEGMTDPVPHRAEIVVDLAAVRHNVRILKDLVSVDGPVQLMAVVKADGYGHGMVEVAAAARDAGADWLGVATIEEALALRTAGDHGPLLCWLSAPGDDFAAAVAAGIEVTAYSVTELQEIAAVGSARVQLKVDTGLSRGGSPRSEWQRLFAVASDLERQGRITVTGIWSHFAASDEPAHPANDAQEAAFREALALAETAGLDPDVTHLANSAATILRPSSHFDLVRCGIATYGLDPAPGVSPRLGLRPAMTVRARLVMSKVVRGR